MGSFSDKEYKKMAKAIVSDYVDQDIPLEEGIKKVACESNMNVHETKRLTEQTNVKAHQDIYEKMAEDKCVEFDVAEPREICASLFSSKESPAEAVHSKTASYNGAGREKTASEKANDVQHPGNKYVDYNTPIGDKPSRKKQAAHTYEPPAPDYEEYPDYVDPDKKRRFKNEKRLKEAAEEIKDEMNIALANYIDSVEKFASRFRYVDGPDLEAFEKKAWAIYGDDAAHPLAEIHEHLGEERLDDQEIKEASNQVRASDKHTDAFGELIDLHKEAKKYAKSLKWCQNELSDKV